MSSDFPLLELRFWHMFLDIHTLGRVDEMIHIPSHDHDLWYVPRDSVQSVGLHMVCKTGDHLGERTKRILWTGDCEVPPRVY